MILMGKGNAEQGLDAVAARPDISLVSEDRPTHDFHGRTKDFIRGLGILAEGELCRIDDVGKKHGCVLQFALDRSAGGEEAINQVGRREGDGGTSGAWRNPGIDGDEAAAVRAKLIPGPERAAALCAARSSQCLTAMAAKAGIGRMIVRPTVEATHAAVDCRRYAAITLD
jgi:hypothetical protein